MVVREAVDMSPVRFPYCVIAPFLENFEGEAPIPARTTRE